MNFEELEPLTLNGEELAVIYKRMKPKEAELSYAEERLLERVERRLYEGLSIADMERLEEEIRTN